MSIAFSRARNRVSCRYSFPPSTILLSTLRPPKRSASKFQTSCWLLPTRSSNDREDEATRVHHASRWRSGSVAARGARAAAGDAGDRVSQRRVGRWVRDLCACIPPGLERHRLRRRRKRRNRVSLGGGSIRSFASDGGRLDPP